MAGYGNPAYFRRGVHNGSGPELRFRPGRRQGWPDMEIRPTSGVACTTEVGRNSGSGHKDCPLEAPWVDWLGLSLGSWKLPLLGAACNFRLLTGLLAS